MQRSQIRNRALVLASFVCLLGLFQTGCGAAYWTGRLEPGTTLSFSRSSQELFFHDTKDNNVAIQEASYNQDTREFTLKGVQVTNMSSPVIAADAARMEQVERIMRIQYDMHRSAHEVIMLGLAKGGELGANLISGGVAALRAIPQVSGTLNTQWGSGGFSVTPSTCATCSATTQPATENQDGE